MIRHPLPILVTLLCVGAAHAGTGNYSNDFSSATGNYYGAANHRGEWSTLQLVGDYGQSFGTWTSGSLSRPDADGPISKFNASFKFAFNNNANGSSDSDGFSFLFGSMADLGGSSDSGHGTLQNWNGGEWGFNNFSRLNGGMSVGFKTYGGADEGVYAKWGRGYGGDGLFGVNSVQGDGWLNAVAYGYANPSNGNGDGNTGLGGWYAANNGNGLTMAAAYIDWTAGGDLVVSIALPGYAPVEMMRTNAFANVTIGDDFEFGLAGRVGGATWDVQIDEFNVNYEYSTPVVPGPAAIAGLAGLGLAGRRRRR